MAVEVHRNCPDRPVFYLVIEAVAGEQFVELPTALGYLEPFVLDLLEAMVAREIVGTVTRQENVRAALEQFAGQADRGARGPQARDRAGSP